MAKDLRSDPFFSFAKREDTELELATGALIIAQSEYIGINIEDYLCRLDEMGRTVRERIEGVTRPEQHIAELNAYLFAENGFRGNTEDYYALENYFLPTVLDNKTGIPITLGVIYIEVGRRAGLPLVGVNFPGHFLVKYRREHLDIFLDVFAGGRFMSEDRLQAKLNEVMDESVQLEPGMLAEASDREILGRILRNLVRAYTVLVRSDEALLAAERVTWLSPDDTANDYRVLGYLYAQKHALRESIAAFEKYLQLSESPPDGAAIEQDIRHLRKLLARLN